MITETKHLNLLVENSIVFELKSVERFDPIFEPQI